MQLFQDASKSSVRQCAAEILECVPPVVWFLRRKMRCNRGNLSLVQLRCLLLVDRQPSANLTAVAEHLGSSLPTTSRIVSGLVERGLLTRQGATGDRRQVSLALTPRGRGILAKARAATQLQVERRVSPLTDGQRANVIDALQVLHKVFSPLNDTPCVTTTEPPVARTSRRAVTSR